MASSSAEVASGAFWGFWLWWFSSGSDALGGSVGLWGGGWKHERGLGLWPWPYFAGARWRPILPELEKRVAPSQLGRGRLPTARVRLLMSLGRIERALYSPARSVPVAADKLAGEPPHCLRQGDVEEASGVGRASG